MINNESYPGNANPYNTIHKDALYDYEDMNSMTDDAKEAMETLGWNSKHQLGELAVKFSDKPEEK